MSLLRHKLLHIDEELKKAFSEQGLSEYNHFIEYKDGLRVSRKSKRDVRTLELLIEGRKQTYFIKQAGIEPFKKAWQNIRDGQWPHSKAIKEVQMRNFLKAQKIPVMNVVAWGEKKIIGWPVSGFLLTEKVEGKEFVKMFTTSGSLLRKQMMRCYGSLVGYTHKIGINSKIRPRDIICISDDFSNYSRSFVLIDRERGNSFHVDMSMEKCATQLAMLVTKSVQDIGLLEKSEIFAFLNGYFLTNKEFYAKKKEFIAITAIKIKSILNEESRYNNIKEIMLKKYRLL